VVPKLSLILDYSSKKFVIFRWELETFLKKLNDFLSHKSLFFSQG